MPLVLALHGDVHFSAYERTLIDRAAALLTVETRHEIEVSVTWDVDFSAPSVKKITEGQAVVLRLEEIDPRIAVMDQAKCPMPGCHVLGWALGPKISIVPSRIAEELTFVHVAMHEMLHVLGVDHVVDPAAIMSPWVTPSVMLTDSDRVAIQVAQRAAHGGR